MSLTTAAYYINDISIPAGTYNNITGAIARYEGEILRQLFGYDYAKLIMDYDADHPENSSQIIRDIVEGKEYQEGDYTVKWNGLLNADKVSILSFYVYIQVVCDKTVSLQNIGATVSDVEGGTVVSPAQLMRKIGYRLRDLAGYPGQSLYEPSLYNFMSHHESSYPLWLFEEYKPVNEYGI